MPWSMALTLLREVCRARNNSSAVPPPKFGRNVSTSTLLEQQSRFGNKLLAIGVVCPQNGTAVLKGLIVRVTWALTLLVLFSVSSPVLGANRSNSMSPKTGLQP